MLSRHEKALVRVREVFAEAGMARFYNQMADQKFALITAYRPKDERTPEQNEKAQRDLKARVSGMDLGFVEGPGVWQGGSGEPTLFITGIEMDDAVALGKAFNQQAVYWGDEGEYYSVSCATGDVAYEGRVAEHFKFLGKEYEAEPWSGPDQGHTTVNKNRFTLVPPRDRPQDEAQDIAEREKARRELKQEGGSHAFFFHRARPVGLNMGQFSGFKFTSQKVPSGVGDFIVYLPVECPPDVVAKMKPEKEFPTRKEKQSVKSKWGRRRTARVTEQARKIAQGGEEIVDKFWIDADGKLLHHGRYVTHQEYALDFLKEQGRIEPTGDKNKDQLRAESILLDEGWIRGQVYSMDGLGLQGKEDAVKSYGAAALQLVPKPKRGYYMPWPGEQSTAMTGADFRAFLGQA